MKKFRTLYCPKSNYHVKDQSIVPKSWFDVLQALGKKTNLNMEIQSPIPYFARNAILFLWSADLSKVIFKDLLSNHIVYLCWGLPNRSKWRIIDYFKLLRLRLVLKLSDLILVNDAITQSEIRQKFGVDSSIIPFFVDPDFYFFKEKHNSQLRLLVVGDKDRDENLVLLLAKRGHKIRRVTRSEEVVNFYAQYPSDNVEVFFRVGFTKLRDLYHDSAVVVLPIREVNHAAGQTVLLEAVAAGCPVVVNGIKSASIGAVFDSVFIPEEDSLLHFEKCINKAFQTLDHHNEILLESSMKIREDFQFEKVAALIAEYIKGSIGRS